MTTKERTAIQTFFNKYGEIREQQEKAFKELQDLNGKLGSGSRWCCAMTNRDDILKSDADSRTKGRATYLYDIYTEARGKEELMREFGKELANLGFWKK